ncbi:fluorothreonine transaldolase [Micromonospora tarapacensis]|uniref:fluorothreonine transaldolase n=1 Tax=Micromonospora tarapacensis TaxID=2835305 RepID=UPI001E3EC013|nr:fluorothreonine transaldolase [Micromonospora tarapacensis]
MTLGLIERLIQQEELESAAVLHLTANETLLSPAAQRVLSTPLSNRYLLEHLEMREDSPSRLNNFLYRGMNRINEIEASATEVCRQLFGAEYAEFRCLSGIHAMQTTFAALSQPGDKIMRISTKDGGHFLTELICRTFGRSSCTYAYRDISEIDLDRTREVFERERPTLLFLDAMNYLFPFPVRELKEMCGPVPLVYDASHTLGLIAGDQFQDPLGEGADILQANTHKTMFGPQKGIILGRSRGLMERISYTLSNGLVSSQHTASALALYIALHEMYTHGREYASRVIESARCLATALHDRGVPILQADRGFTRNHMFFIDSRPLGAGPALLERLLRAGIAVNRSVAFEQTDTLRLGVQEVVRRGFTNADLNLVADWFAQVLLHDADPEPIALAVAELLGQRGSIKYCEPAPEATAPSPSGPLPRPATRRWADIDLRRESLEIERSAFDGAHALGRLAGIFEHQTDSAGNISFHRAGGTFVTATGAYIRDLRPTDFVELRGRTGTTLHCRGPGTPSAESYMHYLMRSTVPAAFVVHNHYIPDDEELDRVDVLVIPPKEYGSVQLAEAVAEAAQKSQVIYVRRHGLVLWGESLEESRELLDRLAFAVQAAKGADPAWLR